ncbi:hypothetical protein HELRODRAFT_188754 [Helobdella robusta]|uniref:UspA domain-containing protein n=1 Tax=Helobdella robusta TaxID=6412 RepID=T1FQB8_HELRO|nr:hypothetical protein HELRODRAFT_188754 [Helobdella robusta]ESO02561.1 hypothetical protein HELRODRAFT_188754 [Helobdella robusta]
MSDRNNNSQIKTNESSDKLGDIKSVKKLSVPYIEDRRRSASSIGHHGRTVLCAVDPSGHSRDAFDWYLKNIWRSDDLVVVAYCPETPSLPSLTFKKGLAPPTEKWKEILDDTNTKTRQLEEDYEYLCREKKLVYKITGESFKNPGEGICKIAEDEKVHMIVMGSRGMGGLKRFLLGSVSEYVVRNSRIPCIVIPG